MSIPNYQEFMLPTLELISDGAEGIILGCTELPMIINSKEVDVPLFDTLKIHMLAAMNFSLED